MGIGNKLDKTNIENIIDLTSLQQGMLFHYINDEKSTEYHEQLSLTITGIVKIELLQKAWDFVIENNEMLRTVFRWKGIDKPIQIILKNHKVLIQKIDMTNELNKDIAVENVKITELKSRIDITKETLRIYLCKLEDCKYEMIISNHHILYDGWSNGIILNELMEAYTNLYDGKELRINNKTKFSEFIKYINNLDAEKQKKYWTNYLQDLGNKDDGFASKSSSIYKEISYKINNIKSNKIKDFAKENRILLSSLLYGTWGVLVQKFTDSNEVMFGTTVSGRPESIKLIDSMVGLFVNTIPLRVKSEGNTTLINLIRNIERMLSERKDFENTSLVDIKGYCGLRADEELFNSIVTIENYPLDLNKDNVLEIENFSIVEKTNYNMALEILTFNGIEFKFNFNSGAIDESIVQKLGGYLERIIDSVIDSPNARISQVEILRKAELNEILDNFNNTKTEYPKDKTIYNLFEEQVNKTPDKVALEFKEEKVTYKELNEKSNQIANYLRENGIKNESIVGIMMSHSIELVIGILAVLKAGGTYLPIDPSYPADRVNYMLEDSQSSMLLVNIEVHEEIQYKGKIVNINKINIDLYIKENLMKINQLNNLAYIIYTSGSTGKPKGVMIEHQGLTNYIWWAKKMYLKDDNDVMALHSSISFDLTITSIFTPLIAGNKIVIYDSDDTEFVLYKILRENKTTVMKLTPAHLSLLKDMDNSNSNIKRFIVGGEDLKVSLAKEVCNSFKKNIEICNEYGPTETVVGCMIYKYNEEKDKGASVPIGYPADNVQIYILDNELNVVPTGFVGELYISGDGVARGYLNREELTRDRFIENPFIKGKQMYRTGDTARYLENGAIEYLGRSDNQVKIRGYRIEVGEIENRLLQHNDIKEAAVVVKENKEKYMCAYVVSKKNADELNLKSYLKETLPEYMIPSYIMQVNKMPLTANGKLDRRALPEPTLEGILNTYEAPRNELEEKLAKIWSELLGIEKVGINDNFFELGGHSLKAIVLMSKIHKELNKEITLKELFKLPTIRELSKLIEDEKESFYSRIEKIEEKDYYEVSSSQKRMYMLQQFEDNSIAYNMPVVFELEGEINRERIEETFKKLVKRHDALRTYFETFEDKIVQRLDNSYEFKLEDTKETEDIETSINKFIRAFKLDKAPLFRVELVENKGKSYLFIDMHHIISDGVSMSILVKEITELYNGEMLKPLRLQYKDFAAWQNNFLKSEEMKIQEEYWINTFSDEIPILNMPNDYERPVIQSFEGDSVSFEVDEKITESLRKLARETGSTMHMVLLSAFNILLSKYSGQEDIVIGTPIAGRTHADLQGIMGIFVNTLALRNKPEGNKKYLDFLKEVKENALNAYENQSYQFEELVEKLDIRRDTSKNPLFDVMFDLSDTVTEEDIKLDGVLLKQYKKKNIISKFDLTLNALEKEKTLEFNLEYCTKIFKKETVERISNHYIKVLDDITRNTKVKIFEIELLTEKEKEQIINEFNDTKADYPKDKTIQELFEEQVKKTPNYTAVVSNDGELTYKELNEKSNQLARILREKGIKQNQTVGVMVERSTEMIVSIMAVLKSGGAYLPIDPEYPLERIKYMLQDSQTQTILTQIHLVDKIEFAGSTIRVDDMSIYNGDSSNLSVVNTCNDMPYIIYTSGTTGKPKGVMIKHRGVVNIANWFNIRYCIEENRNILQMTSISFDVSALEIFTGLLYGGTLYIPQKETILDREKFIKYIKNNKINIAQFVPITLKELLAESDKVDSLRVIISGADRLEDSLKEQIIAKGYNLYNHYGPTETTIDAISSKCENGKVVIGKPIYNTQIYVLNENNQLQPIGVPGELCISSDGLAKGYLNSPDLTAMKFIPNPFLPDKKMYRTGDLVRWLPDGNIEYLCRIDHQVKVRGIRVELGEIERQLLQYEAVREVVVVGKKDEKNNTYLIAYMVSDKKLKVQEVRQYLLADLPSYMVPSYFMQIDSMPLTQNGKIDRKGLPEFSKTMDTSAEYEGPTNEIEHKLLDIWKEVLVNDDIGINDDFFELGGHSLKATVLASKIRKELSIEVALKEIFRSTTIKALAANISLMEKNKYVDIKPIPENDYYPVSSAQKRIFLLSQFEEESKNYNMTDMMIVTGRLDPVILENIFNQLIERHEALRTSFMFVEGELVQYIHRNVDFKIDYMEMEEHLLANAVKTFSEPFDFGKAPLLRVKLIKTSEERYLLFIDMSHVISDGVSINILIKEFAELYEGKKLMPLKIQYKDYSAWQNELFITGDIKKEEDYWLEIFKNEIPMLDMPTDYPRPTIQSFEGNTIAFKANTKLKEKLNVLAAETNTTMYMVLLSAYNILLSKYSGQEDIVIGTPVAGRCHADLQNIVGMFVNTLAMRNHPCRDKTFRQFLNDVKENSLGAFENQNYQFEKLIEKLNIPRQLSRNPIFDVTFSLEEAEDNLEVGNLKFESYDFEDQTAKFDLSLTAAQKSGDIEFSIEYCTKLFKLETINRMAIHYINILMQIVENPNIKLFEIDMLDQEEKEQILYEFNDTSVEYSQGKTIYELFQNQVEKTPDNLAVVFEEKQLTYKELNEKANRLARTLREKGVRPDTVVGIMVESSMEMIVGIIGVLKAGGAYLPVDPKYPEERISYMLEDSSVNILLIQDHIEVKAKFTGQSISLDNVEAYHENGGNLISVNKDSDLAYIIYTSGSTGKPKGVMIEHHNVVAYINAFTKEFGISEKDVILQQATYCFDAFVEEVYPAITTGGMIVVMDKNDVLNIDKLYEIINNRKINLISCSPMFLNELNKLPRLDNVHTFISGGDVLKYEYINNILKYSKVYNTYGPTEATVCATYYNCSKENESKIAIGKPIANYKIYIVNKDNKLQPIGIPGEICISGDGLARGYLNKPELTAEKFITNPYLIGKTMYKTGDLAKWLEDGNLEFLGRIDQQVKIRGFRIELQEIEMKLLEHESIQSVVVVDKKDKDGNDYLCSYIVADKELSAIELRNYLLKTLPDYMIPAHFIQIDKMPVSANGKIDRKALLRINKDISTGTTYKAPINNTQKILTTLWAEVLELNSDKISINDTFFNLGGNSMSLMKLTNLVNNEFEINMKITDFFNLTTIEQIADSIDGDDKDEEDNEIIKFTL